jgi:(E)-4-hydroxy-3-methylbut-2-enyl-diphosphate synthase
VSESQNIKPLWTAGNRTSDILHQTSHIRRETFEIGNIGGKHVPVVVADFSKLETITPESLQSIGYKYDAVTDKWSIGDAAADYIFTKNKTVDFALPGTLKIIIEANAWNDEMDNSTYFPIFNEEDFKIAELQHPVLNFVMVDCFSKDEILLEDIEKLQALGENKTVVLCLSSQEKNAMQSVRRTFGELAKHYIKNPVILVTDSHWQTPDEHLIHFATETGALLLDGMGDGLCLGMGAKSYKLQTENDSNASGRNYLNNQTVEGFINSTAFGILQATRTRISKTEYISCPSCGRTLFDLQETTAKIRSRTNHLKGVKIAIMGCIVNGPGEMADADFGYVGSGVGKITLYKGKDIVKKNINSEIAVDELIELLKENEAWVEVPEMV